MNEPRLWKVWWVWGMPVAWAATALVLGAEFLRDEGHSAWGDALDILRIGVYWFWMRAAWKHSRNVGQPLWTPLARTALLAGFAAHFLA
jgi:hypothetical protein